MRGLLLMCLIVAGCQAPVDNTKILDIKVRPWPKTISGLNERYNENQDLENWLIQDDHQITIAKNKVYSRWFMYGGIGLIILSVAGFVLCKIFTALPIRILFYIFGPLFTLGWIGYGISFIIPYLKIIGIALLIISVMICFYELWRKKKHLRLQINKLMEGM